ncbi:unannotated protein [freshwater metagenome]|uniref:Unannotated protein n=1 Tax=freshwater metagenome TaxID=449393 RepID=A0A6J6B072_9ZZZZ
MGTSAPRAPLDESVIGSLISQYWRVSVVDLTVSTQSDLAELAIAGRAINGDVIVAEYQSSGRGRLDRTFEAPKGSALLFSIHLTPKRSSNDWGFIAHLAALSMREVISEFLTSEAKVKWPNDILIGDKKVAGLISQIAGDGVVIGIGLNVGMSSEELPVSTATSLAIVGSGQLDRNQIFGQFLSTFESKFREWDGGSDFTADYSKVSATLGREIEIQVSGRENRRGLAQSITSTGALILADGFEVNVGDVVHLR